MKVIVNTNPLVSLSKIHRLQIIQKFGSILVPQGVISEINNKQDEVSAAVSKASRDWLKIKIVKDKTLLNVLTKELDGGEAEVICLALLNRKQIGLSLMTMMHAVLRIDTG